MKAFTNADLSKLVGELLLAVPHVEPFVFIMPLRVITAEEWPGPKESTPTACVSAKEMLFVDTFIGSLPRPKQLGLILHEVLHPAFMHFSDPYIDNSLTRRSFRQLQMVAQDIVIEGHIDALSAAFQPNTAREHRTLSANYEPGHYERYLGQDWISVYEDLRSLSKLVTPPPPIDVILEEAFGDSLTLKSALESARVESKAIADRLRSAGKVSNDSSLDLVPEESRARWQDILKDHLTSVPARVRRSWRSVNRRLLATTGEYYPVLAGTKEALENVYLFVDTSGSTHDLLNKVAGDLTGVFRDLSPPKVTIVYYDTSVKSVVEYTQFDEVTFDSMPAGGGTSVKGSLQEFLLDKENLDAPVVFFTDGEDDFDLTQEHIDFLGSSVFWLTYRTSMSPNHGTVINLGG